MQRDVVCRSFTARLSALEALLAKDGNGVETSARELKDLGETYDRYFPGVDLIGFSEALSCLGLRWRWRDAIRSAEPEADRFARAVRLRANEYFKKRTENAQPSRFDELVRSIADLDDPSVLETLEIQLQSLPLGFSSSLPEARGRISSRHDHPSPPPKPKIAFVKFDIDGVPAKSVERLEANVVHDFTLHIRVANWPTTAERLIVEPVSMEDPADYSLPKYVFERPDNVEGPLSFERSGRVVLRLSQSIGARPFEFKYRAVFDPHGSSGGVDLVGHRTIRLESVDLSRRAMSGYPGIDQKLLELRQILRTLPGLSMADLENTLTILARLGNVAGQAIQDAKFPAGMTEKAFQNRLRELLRSDPGIGSELEEHPAAGGGLTDLSFRHIRLELKSERDKSPTPERLSACADQTAQYVVASGRRVGILCVLDATEKKSPPVPPEELFRVEPNQLNASGVAIVSLVIQGGLSKPSDLSKA